MTRKTGAYWLVGASLFLAFVVVMVVLVIPRWERESKRTVLEEQARWMARYLAGPDPDFARAISAFRREHPELRFEVDQWYPARSELSTAGPDDIIVACRESVNGRYPVILGDLRIVWIELLPPPAPGPDAGQ